VLDKQNSRQPGKWSPGEGVGCRGGTAWLLTLNANKQQGPGWGAVGGGKREIVIFIKGRRQRIPGLPVKDVRIRES